MTGGLLQIITSGKEDIYLTIKPQVTFFKKVFRRYTNFSTEFVRLYPEQEPQYDNIITFILNNGDCINHCYLEIDIPLLSFNDNYITNTNYINQKNTKISNLNAEINKWTTFYNNMKGFVDVESKLYRLLYNLMDSENITIILLKSQIDNFNQINKNTKDLYKNKIDNMIYNLINISGYISSTNLLLTNETNFDSNIFISINTIKTKIKQMYDIMVSQLTFYNKKISYYQSKLANLTKSNQINFSFAEYFGHNYFDYFNLEIGGQEIARYSNDMLHINMLHKIKQEYIDNYYKMIGHDSSIYTFNNNMKGGRKIIVPLNFWFNKDTGSALPLVALRNTTVSISAKLNNIYNLICFEDYDIMYDTIINYDNDVDNSFTLDPKLIYNEYEYDLDAKIISYKCLYINNTLLSYVFPDLTTNEINLILTTYGTQYTKNMITKILDTLKGGYLNDTQIEQINGDSGTETQYLMDKNQWISFMLNIRNNTFINIAPKVGSYYPYINFEQYYSTIPKPNINMIVESVYLDDVERYKFASSKLEYVVEVFNDNIFNISNKKSYDCEFSFLNPCKELIWYHQPKIFKDKLTPYGKNLSLSFDITKYLKTDIVKEQNIIFDKFDVLLKNVNMNYYTYFLSYKYLNNILPEGVYYHSFCLYPEETQPSGTANMRELKGKLYKLLINDNFFQEYKIFLEQIYGISSSLISNKLEIIMKFISKSYDMFVVQNGKAKLLFSY
jgi:hypothetical protein